jgi:hypothetical protein
LQARICALTIVNLSCSSQIINNIALNEFDTDVSLYTATLKDVIAACMDGVSPEEIIDMVVEDVTSSAVAASLLRGADVTVQSSSSIRVTYTVTVTVTDDGTYGTLSSELVDAVNSGEFNDYLDEYGNSTGAVYLVGATSNSVTITNINVNDDSSDGSGLSGGAIAGIVIGVLAFLALLGAVGYYQFQRKHVRSDLKAALIVDPAHVTAAPVGGSSSRYQQRDELARAKAATINPISGEL